MSEIKTTKQAEEVLATVKDAEVPAYETKSVEVERKRGNYVVYISPKGNQHVVRKANCKTFEEQMGVDETWKKS